jgi:hypothetical protein
MSKIDTNIVRKLVEKGRSNDLVDLMEGESEYCSESTENIPKSKDELYAYHMALEHLRFVSRFGVDVQKMKEGTHFYSAYPEYFEQWLSSGCVGITYADLISLLADKPI